MIKKTKEQKGITLVALVITIIVLLILAGVTLSIVWNGGIIEKSANAVDKYENASANETNQIEYMENMFDKFYHNATVRSGNSGGSASTSQWTIVTDYGNDGLSEGDLIAPTVTGVTSERFYVIKKDDTAGTVTLLAEYCVDWENANAQDSTMGIFDEDETTGALAFRTNSSAANANVYSSSDIKGYVDAYATKLTTAGLTLEDVEVVEGGTAVTGTKGRLMWGTDSSGEVQYILDSSLTNKSDIVYGPSGAKINYWLGSPVANNARGAWYVIGALDGVRYGFVDYDVYFRSSPSYKSLTV